MIRTSTAAKGEHIFSAKCKFFETFCMYSLPPRLSLLNTSIFFQEFVKEYFSGYILPGLPTLRILSPPKNICSSVWGIILKRYDFINDIERIMIFF